MSESPAESERPGEYDVERVTGRTGTGSASAEPDDPDLAGSERAEAEGTREVSTSEEHGTTGTATRDASDQPEAVRSEGAPSESGVESPGAAISGEGATDDGETTAPAAAKPAKALPKSLTFQLTRTSLLAVLVVVICVTPIAFAQPFPLLLPSYLIPLALTYVIMRPRTVVTADRVASRGLVSTTRFGWDELASVRLNENRWVRAVLTSGKEVVLPAIRVRDLSRLAELSGGRLPDPNSEPPRDDTENEPGADAADADQAAPEAAGTDANPAEGPESEPGDADGRTGPKSAD